MKNALYMIEQKDNEFTLYKKNNDSLHDYVWLIKARSASIEELLLTAKKDAEAAKIIYLDSKAEIIN